MKPGKLCDRCKATDGWLEDEDGKIVGRCPCRMDPKLRAVVERDLALQATADANENAFDAAKKIIRDVAEAMDQFDANHVRTLMNDAQVPTPVIGAAFAYAVTHGWIRTVDYVKSTKGNTHAKRIAVYRSQLRRAS